MAAPAGEMRPRDSSFATGLLEAVRAFCPRGEQTRMAKFVQVTIVLRIFSLSIQRLCTGSPHTHSRSAAKLPNSTGIIGHLLFFISCCVSLPPVGIHNLNASVRFSLCADPDRLKAQDIPQHFLFFERISLPGLVSEIAVSWPLPLAAAVRWLSSRRWKWARV